MVGLSAALAQDPDSGLLLRRYDRRWLIENSITEQLAFFHLNRLFSSMVIKINFDPAMTVPARDLNRLLALQLPTGFQRYTASALFDKLLCTGADVTMEPTRCTNALKKKLNLPAQLETLDKLPARVHSLAGQPARIWRAMRWEPVVPRIAPACQYLETSAIPDVTTGVQ